MQDKAKVEPGCEGGAFCQVRDSRAGLFNDLSGGEFCALPPALLNFPKGTLFNRASHSRKGIITHKGIFIV